MRKPTPSPKNGMAKNLQERLAVVRERLGEEY
jgi:hypothetical protein